MWENTARGARNGWRKHGCGEEQGPGTVSVERGRLSRALMDPAGWERLQGNQRQ